MKYITYKTVLLAPAIAVLVSGCGPELVNRYKECMDKDSHPCNAAMSEAVVSVVLSVDEQKSTKKTGVDLSDRAQAAYIEALSQKSKTVDDLQKSFAAKIGGRSELSGLLDESQFDGTLIVTVSDIGLNPADRLERTEVEIKLNNAKIQSWNAVQTAYTTVNAGEVDSGLKKGGELGLESPSSPAMPIGITAKATIESNLDEKLTITERKEDVTPIFNPIDGSIKIIRHGGFGLNLTGNTLLHATFEPSSTAFEEIFSITTKGKNREWLLPNKLELATQRIKRPRGKDISADVTLRYVVRHIEKGDETYQYGDDIVRMQTKELNLKNVTLLPKEDMGHLTFGLYNAEDPLFIQRPERTKPTALCFNDYESGEDFLDYLNRPHVTHPEMVGEALIGFSVPVNGQPTFVELGMTSVSSLKVKPGCHPS